MRPVDACASGAVVVCGVAHKDLIVLKPSNAACKLIVVDRDKVYAKRAAHVDL